MGNVPKFQKLGHERARSFSTSHLFDFWGHSSISTTPGMEYPETAQSLTTTFILQTNCFDESSMNFIKITTCFRLIIRK